MFIANLCPKRIDDITDNVLKMRLRNLLKSPHNFILEGKENIGKKTTVRSFLCSYFDCSKIHFRSYEERINKNLMGKIKVAFGSILEVNLVHFNVHDKLILSNIIEPYLRVRPYNDKPRFIVIPDIDKITECAAKMIKTFSEKYYQWNIFIGTVESSNALSQSLKHNFDVIKMPNIKDEDIISLVKKYEELESDNEKKEKTKRLLTNEEDMNLMIKYIKFPSGIINYSSFFYIFTNYLIYDEITPTVEEIKTKQLYKSMIELLRNQSEEDIANCKDILFDFYSQHYRIEYLISAILNYLRKDFDISGDFYNAISEIDVRNNKGNRYFIHMECFIFYILKEIVLGKNLKRKSLVK